MRLLPPRVFVTLAALFAAWSPCTHGPRPDPAAAPLARAPDREPDVCDDARAVASRGPRHAPPLRVPATAHESAKYVAFVGSPDGASVAWSIDRAERFAPVVPVTSWPTGVRVLGGLTVASATYVLVETFDGLDGQRAGVRSAVALAFHGPAAYLADPSLAGVRDLADLERRARALREDPIDLADARRVLTDASASLDALARALATGGADYVSVRQGVLLEHLGRVDRGTLAGSPHAARLLAIAREEAQAARDAEYYQPQSVRFAREDGRWTLRAFLAPVRGAAAARPAGAPPPRAVPGEPTDLAFADALRARTHGDVRLVAQAPLDARGTIAVARVAYEGGHESLAVVLNDRGTIHLPEVPIPLSSGDGCPPRGAIDARFADLDGDGRTDVLLHERRAASRACAHLAVALITPPATLEGEHSMRTEPGLAPVLLAAPDADAMLAAALAAPRLRVAPRAACALARRAAMRGGASRLAAPGARRWYFEEPSFPELATRVLPLSERAGDDAVAEAPPPCELLACSAVYPFCAWRETDGPGGGALWFDAGERSLRLAAVAVYGGS